MAIKGTDIIVDNHLDNAIKGAKEYLSVLEKLNVQIVKNAKDLKKVTVKDGTQSAKQIKQLTSALSESELKKRAVLKIDKERQTLDIQLKALNSEKIKQNDILKRQVRDQAKFNKELAESSRKLVGTEEKLIAANKRLLAERKKLDASTRKGRIRLKSLNAELDRNNKILEKNSDKLGKQRIGIGRYSKAIGGLRSGLAQLGLAFGVFTLIKDSFNIIKDFDQAQANLSSVLGVTREQMAGLTEQSKLLGETTIFTASQVSELQLAYAKLGFTQKEIEQVTEATLQLAAAAGTDLANAAEVTGSTLRAFGLDASETQRVVDVMAKSFSSSSLDMEKFAVAMRSVAPVAKNAGLSIERTTALLGTLTDRGIDASTAGTGLRNVFLELSKRGITFEEAMLKINSATDKNAAALELFGKRGAVVGAILAETGADVSALEQKLLNAGGAAKEMADKQLDTLGGAIKLLQSAWEGLILKFEEGSGAGEFLKNILKFLAENLVEIISLVIKAVAIFGAYKIAMKAAAAANKLFGTNLPIKGFGLLGAAVTAVIFIVGNLIDSYKNAWREGKILDDVNKKVTDSMADERAEMDLLFRSLAKTTRGTKARGDALEAINKRYGLTLSNLLSEQAFVIQLSSAYEKLVGQLRKRITLQVIEQELVDKLKALRGLQREILNFATGTFQADAISELISNVKNDISNLEKEFTRVKNSGEQIKLGKGRAQQEQDIEDDIVDIKEGGSKKTVDLKKKELDELRKLQSLELKELETRLLKEGVDRELINQMLAERRIEQFRAEGALIIKLKFDTNEELINLENEYNKFLENNSIDKIDIALQENKKIAEIDEEALKEKQKLEDTANKDRVENLKKMRDESLAIIKEITDGLIENIDKRIEERQREIEESTGEIERLKDLAAQGNVEAAKSIKAERVAIAQEKLEIEALEKKKRNLLITVVALERASQLIGSGDGNPFASAGGEMSGFLDTLKSLSKGTDYNIAQTLGKPQKGGQDGHLAWVDGEEKLLSIENSRKLGGMHQDEVTRRALAYENNLVSTKALNSHEIKMYTDTNIVRELKANTEAIKKMEFPTSTYDPETGEEIIRKGNNVTTYHHKPSTFRI